MITREEKRLRVLFASLVSAGVSVGASLATTSVAGCGAGDDGATRDADASAPSADAGVDATLANVDAAPPVDAGRDASCDPVLLDGADDGNGCEYFESLACGLGSDASSLDCFLYLPECATVCGNAFGYPCLVLGCGSDGAIPSGPLTIECTTGKVSCPDAGRRPAGLVDARRPITTSALGAWLAEVAWLEGASVRAFRRLAEELASMNAPRALVRCASRSARDETRHARVMTRLARTRGATPPVVRVKRARARSREAFAIENAVEGCVREAFGALVATWQAEHAPDADVARAMRRIAIDETRHAALAWSIARWLAPTLDTDTRARISQAMRDAVAVLRCEVRSIPEPLARDAGLPQGKAGAALVDAFAERLGLAARPLTPQPPLP